MSNRKRKFGSLEMKIDYECSPSSKKFKQSTEVQQKMIQFDAIRSSAESCRFSRDKVAQLANETIQSIDHALWWFWQESDTHGVLMENGVGPCQKEVNNNYDIHFLIQDLSRNMTEMLIPEVQKCSICSNHPIWVHHPHYFFEELDQKIKKGDKHASWWINVQDQKCVCIYSSEKKKIHVMCEKHYKEASNTLNVSAFA